MTDETLPRISAPLFIDFFVSKADQLRIYYRVPEYALELALGQTPGWLDRVARRDIWQGESYPNFTAGVLLDVFCWRPEALKFSYDMAVGNLKTVSTGEGEWKVVDRNGRIEALYP
jgi:hypothetical protein